MKFSTTFTLAALTLMSSGTDARIGGGQRELHGHHHSHDHGHHHHSEDYYYDDYDYNSPAPAKGVRCQDPSTYDPTYTPQCINVGSGGYTCENVRMGGVAEYRCVAPPSTAAPTSDEGVSCEDPSTYNPTYTPQCINVGSGGYTCENVRYGGTPDYRCVLGGNQRELHSHHSHGKKCDPDIAGQCFTNGKYTGSDCKVFKLGESHPDYRCTDPTPAPEPKKCHTNHNPTTTPECPSGYICQALRGQDPNHHDGHCEPDRRNLGHEEKQCDPDIAGQCFTNGKYTGSECKLFKLGGSHPDYRCTDPTPPPKEPECTRHCSTGKPCGDSCIADGDTCHKLERGKACWAKTKCTKFCDKGQACGNSCISKGNMCNLSPGEGFACNKEDY